MTIAIVLAAGKGSRMNSDIAKQYLKINGKEVIYYALNTFQNSAKIDGIVLVTGESEIEYCRKQIVEQYGFDKVISICAGGKERYHSVYNGILEAKKYIEKCFEVNTIDKETLNKGIAESKKSSNEKNELNHIVMIHDGARPFVTEQMIKDSIIAVKEYKACTVGMPVKDTIKIVDENNFGIETPNRKFLYQIQTPQSFELTLLLNSYEKMFECENYNITDDTMLVEQYSGVKSKVVIGAYENIKITTPEDLKVAEKFLEKN